MFNDIGLNHTAINHCKCSSIGLFSEIFKCHSTRFCWNKQYEMDLFYDSLGSRLEVGGGGREPGDIGGGKGTLELGLEFGHCMPETILLRTTL